MKKAETITNTIIPRRLTTRKRFRWDIFMLSTIFGLAFVSWIVVLILQFNGVVATAKGCKTVRSCFNLGDGQCNMAANTAECGWYGGDCVVPKFPDCHIVSIN